MFFLTSGHLEISFGCYGVLDGDGPQLGKVIGSYDHAVRGHSPYPNSLEMCFSRISLSTH